MLSIKSLKILIYISPVILVFTFRIGLINYFSLKGQELPVLEDKKANLVKENTILKNKSAELSSLTYIQERSVQLNLIPMRAEFLETPALASR